QEAVELHIQRVYIIHGIGSGRLKTEVYDFLYKHPKVVRFANDYHPQYGMGATEVKFR
nr:Smr/MutS family protein [Saprospiraceae bacterium]